MKRHRSSGYLPDQQIRWANNKKQQIAAPSQISQVHDFSPLRSEVTSSSSDALTSAPYIGHHALEYSSYESHRRAGYQLVPYTTAQSQYPPSVSDTITDSATSISAREGKASASQHTVPQNQLGTVPVVDDTAQVLAPHDGSTYHQYVPALVSHSAMHGICSTTAVDAFTAPEVADSAQITVHPYTLSTQEDIGSKNPWGFFQENKGQGRSNIASTASGIYHTPLCTNQIPIHGKEDCAAVHQARVETDQTLHESIDVLDTAVQESNTITDSDVCFGMITELRGCILGNHTWTSNVNAAKLTSSQTFQISDIPVQGFFEQETTEMLLEGLLAEPQLQFQVWCRQRSVTAKKSANSVRSESTTISSCLLDLIIYGPESLFTIVGDYLNDHESYLQNPQMCDRNILYRNPHTLAGLSSASPLTTWQLHGGDQIEDTEGVTIEDHSLDHFTTEECLDEATQPQALSTQLKKHQKQALTFMLRRETGWRMDDTCPDIWESRKGVFMNRITGRAQTDRPSDFQGGIVSDPMGLGKTLSMLSLIAMDLEIEACTQQSNGKTLVVVPSALLGGWEEQITEHVRIGTLRQTFHHGRSKLRHGSDLSICGVIITTYETIRQEWSGQACHYSPLFATEWHRIVLDEAHIIRNSKSQTSQAVCALRARSRWAMTGTPIQNKLDELSALLHFLRAEPYSQNLAFQSDIVDPWKRGDLKNGLPRLHCLLQCLMLRRPKTIIDLPPRKDLKLPLEFTPAERAFYQGYLDDTKQRVREALSNPVTANGSYFNALQRIDALRRICNTGCHFQKLSVSTHRTSNYAQGDTSQSWISDTLEYLLELENTCCRMCNVTIGGTQGPLFTSKSSPWLRVSKCMALTCTSCVNGLNAIKGAGCDHVPACEYATINPEIRAISQRKSSSISSNTTLPSKVSALITHLQGTVTRAKSLVFSYWSTTLDLVEIGLKRTSIAFVRFDGKTSQKGRKHAIDSFRHDPSIKVMLITLSCGAAGLNLTAASCVYLMEPHWNPTVEEQALARVHRIGQTREVTTYRLYIRDSFEEQVMKTQFLKIELAQVVLGKSGQQDEKHQRRLEALINLL